MKESAEVVLITKIVIYLGLKEVSEGFPYLIYANIRSYGAFGNVQVAKERCDGHLHAKQGFDENAKRNKQQSQSLAGQL